MNDQLLLKFGADTAQLQSSMRGAMKSIAGIAAAFVSARAVAQSFSKALEMGGRLNDLASRTGVAAGQLALLERAFKNSGASADKLGPTINKMQKSLEDAAGGSKEAEEALGLLGLAFSDLEGMSPDKQFQTIGQRIQDLNDPTKRAAAAMGIFGKSGGELLPFFRNFSGEMTTASSQLGSLPGIMDRANQGFDNMGDKLGAIQEKGTEFAAGVIAGFGEIQTSLDTFDAAGIGEQLGQGFGALTSNLQASLEAVWLHSLGQIATMGNNLVAGFTHGGAVLSQTFKQLGDDAVPTLGKLLLNALGAAAATFQRLLINAGLDFLTTMSAVPALAASANAGIQALIEANSKAIVAQQTFNAGAVEASNKIKSAFTFASAVTPEINKDIFGAGEKLEAAAKAAQKAMGMTATQISDPLQGQFSAMPQWMKDRLGLGAKSPAPDEEEAGASGSGMSGPADFAPARNPDDFLNKSGTSYRYTDGAGNTRARIDARAGDRGPGLYGDKGDDFTADVFSGKESPAERMVRENKEAKDKRNGEAGKRKSDEAGKGEGAKQSSQVSTLETMVAEIKALVEKIEPKLPVAALTA